MTAPTPPRPVAPKPNPSLFLYGLARKLGIDPADHQSVTFDIDGHRILSLVVSVKPSMARRWLTDFNAPEVALSGQRPEGHTDVRPNRRLSEHISEGYERQMRDGRWLVSPQNILAFDHNGYLLDGQHRLQALVNLADGEDMGGDADDFLALTFRVEIGWPREAFAVIDSGNKRAAHQLLRVQNSMMIIGATRILAVVSGQASPGQRRSGDPYRADADSDLLLRWEQEWHPHIRNMVPKAEAVYRHAKINKSTHLAVLTMAAMTTHAGMIDEWVRGIIEGANMASTDPRLLLRNRWTRDSVSLGASTHDRLVLLIKAWNAFASGREVGVLKVGASEAVPPLVGFTSPFGG